MLTTHGTQSLYPDCEQCSNRTSTRSCSRPRSSERTSSWAGKTSPPPRTVGTRRAGGRRANQRWAEDCETFHINRHRQPVCPASPLMRARAGVMTRKGTPARSRLSSLPGADVLLPRLLRSELNRHRRPRRVPPNRPGVLHPRSIRARIASATDQGTDLSQPSLSLPAGDSHASVPATRRGERVGHPAAPSGRQIGARVRNTERK